ncbi:MAG: hypothetical protein WBR26_17530, partial [Candidatus Acidiferrum sp.]
MIRKFGRNASLGLLVLVGAALPTVSWQAGGGAAPAAPPSPVPTVDLHRADVIRFSAPGPAAVLSTMKCGPGGDIYVIYSSTSSQEMAAIPIRRISVFSRSVTEYAVPAISGYRRLARLSFDVSADGSLYALLQAIPQTGAERKSDPAYLIVKYKDDGNVDSYVVVGEIPGERIHPTSLAMFGAGNSLVSGTTVQKTAEGTTSLGVFSAMFDRGGTFRAPVTL